jgi:hypothetical protein
MASKMMDVWHGRIADRDSSSFVSSLRLLCESVVDYTLISVVSIDGCQ